MDFNLILLLAGVGLLALVLLFALWGFLGGLKRELSCIAVFIVLLVLSWLVFGDAATFLNAEVGQMVADILGIKDNSIVTLWDAILVYAREVVPNGSALLVEGKETYSLFYSIAATVCRAAGLIVGTIAILIICPIIRLITHIICLIVRGVVKRKAAKKAKDETGEEPKKGEQIPVESFNGGEQAVVTKSANEFDKKAKGKNRIWGGVAGAIKGVFVVLLICAPLSGLSAILKTATPETQKMLSNLVSGKAEIKVENSTGPVDMAFDFVEAYENSALGKFANASSFFFNESVSEKLFANLLKMETKTQTIYLGDEIKEFIEVANSLKGNLNFARVTEEQFKGAVEGLKDSKLIIELMPVAIEYGYEIKDIQKLIVEAGQTEAFLDLRYNDWKKDIDAVLDAVKEAYDLDLFPIKDFEVLGMNVEELKQVTNILGSTELMNDALPIGLAVTLKLEAVEKLVGKLEMPDIDDYNLKQELNDIVDIYAKVQKLDQKVTAKLGTNESIREILSNSDNVNILFDTVYAVIDLQLVEKLAVPAAFGFLENNKTIKDLFVEAGEFNNLMALENEFTLDDLKIYVEAIKIALNLVDLSEYPTIKFNYFKLDPDQLDRVIDQLFSSSVTNKVVDMGINVALTLDQIKNFENGLLTEVDYSSVDWYKELKLFVNIYRSVLQLGIESEEELKGDLIVLLQGILENETKFAALTTALTSLVDTQLYTLLGVDAIQHFVDKFVDEKYGSFSDIIDVTILTKEEWKEDITTVLEMAQNANNINVLENLNPFDYTKLDLSTEDGINNIKAIISNIFDLNILGDDQLKTELLFASVYQFNWTIIREDLDLSGVKWDDEEQVLLDLVDVYKKINDLEEFDIYNLKELNYVALLENDVFLDYIVEALEVVVDSKLVLELLPGLLDKHVLPKLDDIQNVDDETLFNDLFNNLPSEELVNELIKLVDVVRAAVDMNLLKAKDGLNNVDLANTEALKTIISGILDSKIIQGYEGRIIRILLKITNILDIPKDSQTYEQLVNLDYTGEKDILLAFVDAITPVLKDSTFKLVDENNKLKLDLEFWAQDVNAQTLLEGFKVLFGTYEENEGGSKLIEILIPNIYDKFIEEKDLIPTEYKEIVEILDVTNASGEVIINDLRCIVYILEQLVAMDAQVLLNKGDFEIATDEVAMLTGNIIDALHDMQLFKGNESETLAWVVNFAADKLKVEIDDVTNEFDDVNWDSQKELYKDIINDIISLLKDNNLITYNDVMNFIKNKEYNSTTFINKENATAVLNILDKLIDVEVIDAIIPLVAKFGVNKINEKGFDLSYINDFSNEELAADFHQFVKIAHTLVEDVDIVAYYIENFNGNMPLPNEAGVVKAVDQIFDLNVIKLADGKLATIIYNKIIEKVIPADKEFILDISDFSFDSIDWTQEKEVVKGLVSVVYDALEVNNILTMADVRLAISEKWYMEPAVLRKETGHVAADALRVIKDSQILQNVIEKLYNYAIFIVEDSQMVPFGISYLRDMPKDLLAADLGTLADILDLAVDFGVLEYITDKDIRNMDLELLAQAVEKLYDLNVIQRTDVELLTEALNHVLYIASNKTNYNFGLTKSEVESMDIRAEFVNLANIIRALQPVLNAKDATNLNDLLLIVNNAEYKNKEFFDKDTYSAAIDVAREVLKLQTVELLLPQGVDFGVYLGNAKGTDISFIKDGRYTTDLILEDLNTILDIADTMYDFGVIDLVFEKTLYTIETEVLCDVLDHVGKLHLLNFYFHDILPLGVNLGMKMAKIDVTYTKDDFADVVLQNDLNELKDVIRAVKDLLNEKDIITLNDVNAFIGMGEHKKESCYDTATGEIIESIVTELMDVVTVQSLLPKLLNYGVDRVVKPQIGFLKDAFTKEQLAHDIKLLATLIVPAIEADMVSLAFGTKVNDLPLHFDIYSTMLENVKDSYILNMKWADIVSVLTNLGLEAVNSRYRVTLADFEGIKFSDEVLPLQETLKEVNVLLEKVDATNIAEITQIFKEIKDIKYSNKDVVSQVLNVVDELLDAATIEALVPTMLYHGADFLEAKGYNVHFLFEDASKDELVTDVNSIITMAADLVDYGMVEFALHDGAIDVSDITPINDAIATLFNLNVMENNEANLIFLALDTLKISKDGIDLSTVNWDEEVTSLQNILNNAKEILIDQNADQMSEIKSMNIKKYITISESTNSYIDLFTPIIDAVSDDQLVEALALNVASKYLEKLDPKYNGLVDIHNIYDNGTQFVNDLADLSEILRNVKVLNIYSFLVQSGNYPFVEVEAITNIIELALSLEYFNTNDNRVNTIIAAVDPLVKLDLSNIDATGVNLRSDAPIIAEIYEDLVPVLTHEKWLINNKNDLQKLLIHKDVIMDPVIQEILIDSLIKFATTTIFDKMAPGLVLMALPYVEKAAPKYYEALELGSVTTTEIDNDLDLIVELLLTIDELDLVTLNETKAYITSDVENVIIKLIDVMGESMILNNHGVALGNLLFDDFVNGKTIAGISVPAGTFTATGVDFDADKDYYKSLVNELFDLCFNQNITTIDELKTFINNLKLQASLENFLGKEETWESFENISNIIANITMVDMNGLAVIENIIMPKLPATIKDYISFADYSNAEFASDVDRFALLVSDLRSFGIDSIIRNEDINYDQETVVRSIAQNIVNTYFVKYNLDGIIDLIDSRNILPIKLEALKSNEFDYINDADILVDAYVELIPFLVSSDNTLHNKEQIEAFIKNGFKTGSALNACIVKNLYLFVNAYDELVKATIIPVMYEDLVEFVQTKLPEKYRGIVDAFEVANLTFGQKQEDALMSATILRTLVDFGLYDIYKQRDINFAGNAISTLNNSEVEIAKLDMIDMLIDQVYAINALRNYGAIVIEALNSLGVETSEIDFTYVDWDNEKEAVKLTVHSFLAGLLDYEIETAREFKDYLTTTINKSKMDILREAKNVLKTINLDNLISFVDGLSLSDGFDQIALPVYNKFILSRVSGNVYDLLDLTGYTPNLINEDMQRATVMVRDFKLSTDLIKESHDNIHKAECIDPTADFILQAFSLNVADLKKQDVVTFLDTLKPSLNFNDIDLTNVDLKQEGLIYSSFAEELLVIVLRTRYLKLDISKLGDTELMTAIIDLYNGVVNSSSELYKEGSTWLFSNVIYELIIKIGNLDEYTFTEEKVQALYEAFGETLYAMLDMGVFSNNGIDFTNSDNTDRLFKIFEDVLVPTGQFATHLRNIKNNMYEFGYIPFTYEYLSTSNEIDAAKTIISSLKAMYTNHFQAIRNDKTYITDPTFQLDLTNLFKDMLTSEIFEQLLVPGINGLVKIYTKDVVKLTFLDGVDNVDFIYQFLPDAYNIIGALNELGFIDGNIIYNDADAIVNFAKVVVESESTKDHVGDIMKFVFYLAGIDIRDVDFTGVDWKAELDSLEKAGEVIKPYLATVNINDKSTYISENFAMGIALATPYFESSKVLPLIIRQFVDTVNEKVFNNRFDRFIDRLYETTYTNESLMKDFSLVDEILMKAIETDYLDSGINYANLYPYVELLELVFKLEYLDGMEAEVLKAAQNRISIVKNYTLDFEAVTDWENEKVQIINVAHEFAKLSEMAPFDQLSTADIQNPVIQDQYIILIDALSKSVLGQQLLPQAYEENFEDKLGNEEYKNLIDFNDPTFTPDMWADEFRKIFDAYNILTACGFGSKMSMTVDQTIEVMTILFGTEEDPSLGVSALVKDPQYWVTKLVEYDAIKLTDGAEANLTSERDWSKEPYRIIAILKAMKPFANAEGKFSYDNAYYTTNEEALGNLLLAINESVTIQGSLVQVISNLMETVPGVETRFIAEGIVDAAFYEELALYQANKDHYNDEYWTDEKILEIARVVADTNNA